MATPAHPLPLPPLDSSLGAIEVGATAGMFLFGIGTLQTFYFFRKFPNDKVHLKATVALLWMLELGHTLSTSHALYSLTVTFYGQPQHIESPPHSLQMTILFSAPIYFIVQIFFANRIRALTGRWPITVICWFLTLLRAVCTLAILAVTLRPGATITQLEGQFQWLLTVALSLGVAVDVIIAAALCHCLYGLRGKSGAVTKKMVDTMIVWTLGEQLIFHLLRERKTNPSPEAGTLTGGTSVATIVIFAIRHDLAWFSFYLVLAKLFSNSMLASLNGRQHFRAAIKPTIVLQTTHTHTHSSSAQSPRTPTRHSISQFEMHGLGDMDEVKEDESTHYVVTPKKDIEAADIKQMFRVA
ncbi:unnamed protein product [Mycena citricolor]|uniref:DUF6534 domain-containing protein n=1 Tax=Mycena citricolor TaxID=2018698 RepID=A0AAD2HQG7_9AGAR|nr:unnamed protein product [Mycena citricolor]